MLELTFKFKKLSSTVVRLKIDQQKLRKGQGQSCQYLYSRRNFMIRSDSCLQFNKSSTIVLDVNGTNLPDRPLDITQVDFESILVPNIMDFNQLYSNNKLRFEDVFVEDTSL